jgi:DNA-binding NarL/FixJ family response regulator
MQNLTPRLDAADDLVLVVTGHPGDPRWPEPPGRAGTRCQRCPPEVASLRRRLAVDHPRWLVVGPGIDEDVAAGLVTTAWQAYPDIELAMLGPLRDLKRCERWLRRGCRVYLPDSTSFASVLRALDCAAALDATLVDRSFHLESARSRHVGPAPSLTERQHEVLSLLDRQLTNPEIADALHVSENTIEFHVRRLLDKLGARNRVHAVRRAQDMGLI